MYLLGILVSACLVSLSISSNIDEEYLEIDNRHVRRERMLLNRSSELTPIRITPFYLNEQSSYPMIVKYIKEVAFPSAYYFLKKTLKVKAVYDKIKSQYNVCRSTKLPSDIVNVGVGSTDFVLYMSFIGSVDYFEGYYCQFDDSNVYAPVIGLIEIGNFNRTDYLYARLLKSIMMALGWYANPATYWRDQNGNKYKNPIDDSYKLRGKYTQQLTTPNILTKAKEIFNCNSLIGLEVEDYDRPNRPTVWDRRIMYNDIMTVKLIKDPIISAITLAGLKDTGWYDVDYSMADSITYGIQFSCSFFETPCSDLSFSTYEFCGEIGAKTCDYFSLYKSICTKDDYADQCSIRMPLWNGNCRAITQSDTVINIDADEVVGPNSHCFESTLSRKTTTETSDARCYEVIKCSNNEATVKIGSTQIKCPFTGGTFNVEGYKGIIKCPNSKILCLGFPCIENCLGYGKCINGVCNCDPGFSGNYCQYKCGALCKTCDAKLSCLTCLDNSAVVKGSVCECKTGQVCSNCLGNCNSCTSSACNSCKSGYLLNNGVCERDCGKGCIECTIKTICTQCSIGFFLKSNLCESCPFKCDECTSASNCKKCSQGYYFTPPSTCSRACSTACIGCEESTGACSSCKTGFFLDSDESCIKCPEGCEKCNSLSDCTSCSTGYVLNKGKCSFKCPNNCEQCTSESSCSICNEGYFLDNTSCGKCSVNCDVCSSSSQCSICKKDFTLDNGQCISPCPENCKTCKSSTKCTVCKSKYFLKSGSCSACSKGCKKCSSSKQCSKCSSKYYLSGKECVACSDKNCKKCNKSKCLTCSSGYTLKEGKCKK
jgi:hypothetical protein